MATSHFPFLTVLVLTPAVGAAVVALIPPRAVAQRFHEAVGALVGLFTLILSLVIVGQCKVGVGGYQLVSDHIWAKQLGIHWSVGVDGISLFLVVMTALLFPLTILGARGRRDPRAFVAWILLMEAACLGSFVSLDLVLFFLFFELTLVPAYFIIGGWGYARRGYAAIKFFVYTFAGSAFLLVGILAVAFLHQSQTGVLTFELPALMHTHLSGTEGVLLFCAFTAAFAVKAPVFPFHTWSPDAYAEAPTAGAVLLAAVMAKLGTYGIIRFDLNLFPQATRTLAPWLLTLAVIGHPVRGHRGLRPARPEAPAGLLVAGPDRLHRARDVRPQQPGADRRRAPDGQPRPDHRHPVHPGGVDLRAAQDVAGHRAEGPAVARPGDGRGVHRGHAGLHRGARAQRVRR